MIEVLKSPLVICIRSNGSVNKEPNWKHTTANALKMVSIVEEFGSGYRIQQPTMPRIKWLFGSMRRKGMVMLARIKSELICEERRDNILIQKGEEELVRMPPWGNVLIQGDCGFESGSSQPSFNLEAISSTLETRLHYLEERDEEILSKRILSLSRSNKVRSALELFMSMDVSGLRPNLHACNSLLSCLLRNELLNDALRVFEIMKEKVMTTGHTYSLILKAIARAQGYDSALKLFLDLEAEGTLRKDFDTIVYNTIISVCAKANNWVQAERTWICLKENGQIGTTVTYRLLVGTFVRCGQIELALNAYHEMILNGLKPSEDMMQAIIVVCTKEGKWGLALSVFQNMLDSGMKLNAIAYNALINSLGKAGEVELAFRVYNLMRSSDHKPDVYTWNALLGALYRGNRYADTLHLFKEIKREHGSQLNPHLYNTALMSCQRLGLWDRSLQLLWQMEANGFTVTTASYNLVIGACEVARKPKVALQVYQRMVHQRCSPDTFTNLSLIRSCIWGSLWIEVEEILESATPNASLYNAVIHGMCLQGQITSAKRLYMKMRESGITPDGKTRAFMLQNLTKDSVGRRNRYCTRPCHYRRG